MMVSKAQGLFMLCAVMLIVGTTASSSGSRALLQDKLGLQPCTANINVQVLGTIFVDVQVASHCPHDGQAYAVCLKGAAAGGCRPEFQGAFAPADCQAQCFFQST